MKYLNLTKSLAVVAMLSLVFTACKKAKVATPLGDAGQTLVKLLGGGTPAATSSKPIDFVNTPTKILAVEVRRDIPSETELNKVMVVTVKDDTAAVTAWAAGSTNKFKLPVAWYTVAVAGGVKTGGEGGTFTITFQPGEFSKSIFVTVPDATVMNPSFVYGLGFTVLTADQGAKLSTQKSMVIEIGAKNAYDGIYSVESGFVQRYSGPGPTNPVCCDNLTGPLGAGNDDVYLFTTGAYTVGIPNSNQPGRMTWSFLTTPNSGVAGIDGVRITVDPATNLVSSMCLGNATFANFPGYTCKYIPATKTFDLNWRWNPTATTRDYQVVYKYKGPR
ncbi:MAG: hypothetical protein IPL54_12800 [Chitinophagaceae bacterium]|nr:hypothetical protein [Chitinophagaceae bacterium]